ncbi:MAG: DUF2752 domain-containing protein [Clostridia bacterium]|nr:DUF2752 domain-containing protein [Clostridia bacterium]
MKNKSFPSIFYRFLPSALLITVIVIVALDLYDCPTKVLLGFPCPGCGMTDAYFSLLKFDIPEAFQLHCLFPIPAFWFIYHLIRRKVSFSKQVENLLVALSALLFIIRWIINLFI